jgi:hypothetical protein
MSNANYFSKMNRLKNKKYIGYIGALIGAGLSTYVIHKQLEYIESDKFQEQLLIKQFQSKSTVIALSNYQIEKMFGPTITTTVNNEIFERFKPECKSFSVSIFCNYNQ